MSAFLVLLTLLLGAASAHADAIVIGQPCDQLGTTTMTTDQKSIAACLKDDNGKLYWKSTTTGSSASPKGTLCGWASAYTFGSMANPCGKVDIAPCQGTSLVAASGCNATTLNKVYCPQGYTPLFITGLYETGNTNNEKPSSRITPPVAITCIAN